MTLKPNPIPHGCHTVNVFMTVNDAAKAVEFYRHVFGATEIGRIKMPNGQIGHCELQIGDSRIMLADEIPESGNQGPLSLGGSPISMCLYVENPDKVFRRALEAGAQVDRDMDMKDQFYGDRSGSIIDPFGHKWIISTHIEDVAYQELQERANEMFSKELA
jgi:PhnB protein